MYLQHGHVLKWCSCLTCVDKTLVDNKLHKQKTSLKILAEKQRFTWVYESDSLVSMINVKNVIQADTAC